MVDKTYDNVFVIAPEGSGSTFLWKSIIAVYSSAGLKFQGINDINYKFEGYGNIFHISLPHFRPPVWLDISRINFNKNKIILISREKIFSVYSSYNRFSAKNIEGLRETIRFYEKAKKKIENIKKKSKGNYIQICYENLILNKEEVIDKIICYLELKKEKEIYSLFQNKDMNKKPKFIEDLNFLENYKKIIFKDDRS